MYICICVYMYICTYVYVYICVYVNIPTKDPNNSQPIKIIDTPYLG